eukprot:CAMPEP_0170528448 /NCGR_PEP_ID=MMETSP0209-20121228/13949_1 /TAXON_ID=665100 ORGANISM="Litonotus pictus, Strain P1" /NCGR_SAMPLE_ID=MMETSP0209 /ASSEMBLY_ACC=CAM_ASM_000301 /LENGTH=293 /DNA_ID=CAMNT_0010819661 /DNA_START=86 /DNA_END=967 /DNA_ORIENTATION=-
MYNNVNLKNSAMNNDSNILYNNSFTNKSFSHITDKEKDCKEAKDTGNKEKEGEPDKDHPLNTTNNSIILNTSLNSIQNNPINEGDHNNNSTVNLKSYNSPNIGCLSQNLSTSSIESLLSIEEIPKPHYNRRLSGMNTKISYFEESSFYNRPLLNQKVNELLKMYPELESWTINEITDKSWFSVLWTPKAITYGSEEVSFLVFYRFKNKGSTGSLKSIPILGVLGNKIDEDNQLFWFANPNATNVYDFKVQDEFMRSKSNYLFYSENAHVFVNSMNINNFLDYNIIRSRLYENN